MAMFDSKLLVITRGYKWIFPLKNGDFPSFSIVFTRGYIPITGWFSHLKKPIKEPRNAWARDVASPWAEVAGVHGVRTTLYDFLGEHTGLMVLNSVGYW